MKNLFKKALIVCSLALVLSTVLPTVPGTGSTTPATEENGIMPTSDGPWVDQI